LLYILFILLLYIFLALDCVLKLKITFIKRIKEVKAYELKGVEGWEGLNDLKRGCWILSKAL
jgi:hypothetical protein